MLIPHSRPSLDQTDAQAVADAVLSGNIAQGEKVREFEDKLAKFVGTRHGVAVSSGTSALHLALLALGVGLGDEVVIPSYVCSSLYFATLHAGAVPKVVDIDLSDLNISSATVKQHLSQRTKAMIVPHMFGTPAELDELINLGVPIVEDCAQSLGAKYKGRQVGSFGELSVFSFYATKMITTGEGGMVLTDNATLYERLTGLRDYDKKPLTPPRYNYKMNDIEAALGLNQLRRLPQFIERRVQTASLYQKAFSRFPIGIPSRFSHKESVFFRYIMMVKELEETQASAKRRGIMCERPVFQPIHKGLPNLRCPNSDKAHDQCFSVPLYPNLSDRELQHIVNELQDIFSQKCPKRKS